MKNCLLGLILIAAPVFAQDAIKDALVKHWKSSADFTLAVAKTMPAENYNFSPNPEEMNFGQVIAHIGAANLGACVRASGMPRPTLNDKMTAWLKDQKTNVDKDAAIQFLTDTFAFCTTAVAAMTPEKLNAKIGPEGRQLTGFETLWSYFTHTAHHRGQAEVYMRVKGIKPPDYVF